MFYPVIRKILPLSRFIPLSGKYWSPYLVFYPVIRKILQLSCCFFPLSGKYWSPHPVFYPVIRKIPQFFPVVFSRLTGNFSGVFSRPYFPVIRKKLQFFPVYPEKTSFFQGGEDKYVLYELLWVAPAKGPPKCTYKDLKRGGALSGI